MSADKHRRRKYWIIAYNIAFFMHFLILVIIFLDYLHHFSPAPPLQSHKHSEELVIHMIPDTSTDDHQKEQITLIDLSALPSLGVEESIYTSHNAPINIPLDKEKKLPENSFSTSSPSPAEDTLDALITDNEKQSLLKEYKIPIKTVHKKLLSARSKRAPNRQSVATRQPLTLGQLTHSAFQHMKTKSLERSQNTQGTSKTCPPDLEILLEYYCAKVSVLWEKTFKRHISRSTELLQLFLTGAIQFQVRVYYNKAGYADHLSMVHSCGNPKIDTLLLNIFTDMLPEIPRLPQRLQGIIFDRTIFL